MHEEGVIKFDLRHRPGAPLSARTLAALDAWRTVLHDLGLIGRDPARYGGAGYGNVSRRLPAGPDAAQPRFVITGTQTGHLPRLTPRDYAVVTYCDAARNRVDAQGPAAPSSEALTHAMLYRLDAHIAYVYHVHAPAIWRARDALGLPVTEARVPYGTPAMAEEVARLYADPGARRLRVLAMGGHEDGIIAYGRDAAQPGLALVRLHARALALR